MFLSPKTSRVDMILHDSCNLTKQPLDGDKDTKTAVSEHFAC